MGCDDRDENDEPMGLTTGMGAQGKRSRSWHTASQAYTSTHHQHPNQGQISLQHALLAKPSWKLPEGAFLDE